MLFSCIYSDLLDHFFKLLKNCRSILANLVSWPNFVLADLIERCRWKNRWGSVTFKNIFLLLKWQYLWTYPDRKPRTKSSSFSNTNTTPNFQSFSLTVFEFWKRYHQKLDFRVFPGASKSKSRALSKFSLMSLFLKFFIAQFPQTLT